MSVRRIVSDLRVRSVSNVWFEQKIFILEFRREQESMSDEFSGSVSLIWLKKFQMFNLTGSYRLGMF